MVPCGRRWQHVHERDQDRTDTYSVAWIRPEGRANTYSDKGGKNEIRRSVSVRTTTDLVDHVKNITERPTSIVIDVLGPKVVFPKA